MSPARRIFVLPDGRRLAYTEWGAARGQPVLYCHGFPGSRLEARLADGAAQRLGIRLIAADRPGFGASDPRPGRRLSDWPADLAALADHLGVSRFHLLGLSGGGPYALACAEQIAERLRGVAIVCGLGELADPQASAEMAWPGRLGIGLYRRLPEFADWIYGRLAGPFFHEHPAMIYRLMTSQVPPADREVLDDPDIRESILTSFAEAFHQGGEGAAQELGVYTGSWEIDPGRIEIEVQLWHGEADTIVPVAMGRRHAALLPRCEAHFVPGEGHFSLVVRWMGTILERLLAPESQRTAG